MGTLNHKEDHAEAAEKPSSVVPRQESSRQRRLTALQAAQGLWKDRTDVPKDGVEYQEQLRDEWR